MKRESTLSEYVQDYIESLDLEGSPEETAEGEQTRKAFEVIVDNIISSRETMTDGNIREKLPGINAELPLALFSEKLIKLAPELIRYFLDRHFTCDLLKAVPGYVERTMQLSRLQGLSLPSKTTNGYLREASVTELTQADTKITGALALRCFG